jgi:hypothetical protein
MLVATTKYFLTAPLRISCALCATEFNHDLCGRDGACCTILQFAHWFRIA